METLKSIRLQLSAVEDAWRSKRMRDFVDSLLSIHDMVDIMVNSFLGEQFKALHEQIEKLAELGLVTADLEEKLQFAQHEAPASDAVPLIQEIHRDVRESLDTSHKLLLRTNIFPRGKKTFVPYEAGDTLRDCARLLRKRYARQIEAHLRSKGADVVVPDAVDILFYGARVWEDPDEALLSEHTKLSDLMQQEPKGVLWFPVLPGDSPILSDEEDDSSDLNDLLENFTIETNVDQLEEDMQKLSEKMGPTPPELTASDATPSGVSTSDLHASDLHSEATDVITPAKLLAKGGRSTVKASMKERRGDASVDASETATRAILLRGEGTEREERIPLVGSIISLGRGRENDIQILNDIKVSRFHCRILREEDSFFIEDNTSSNGTLVNSELISRRELVGGENVSIGNTVFRFLKESSHPTAA